MGYIYIHVNKINGKKYIGQTTLEPSKRWRNGNGYKGSIVFYNAIKKYGWDNFEHYYFPCPNELLDDIERFYINYHDTLNPSKGYNLESGGNNNKNLSEETKRKMSESRMGEKNPNYGKHHSEETRARISESGKGNHNALGKPKSEETIARMSESHERLHYIIQSPSDEVFETTNLRAFCKEHGIDQSNMCHRGQSKGYILLSKEEL